MSYKARVAAVMSGLCLAASVSAYNAAQVNAKAVSVQWRHGIGTDWSALCCECWEGFALGAVVVYSIRDGAVQPNPATIHSRDKGMAHYPVFSLNGRQVAFYRSSSAPEANGRGCVTVNGGKYYVSVINTDGTGLTNLVEIPRFHGQFTEIVPLAWPGGDWIYYEHPCGMDSDPANVDIWRVNAVTGAAEEVCSFSRGSQCTYWRRFTMTADGSYMAGQTMGKYNCSDGVSGGNCVWPFPAPGCDLSQNKSRCRAACNIAISPSGDVVGSYFSGAHTSLELGQSTPEVYSFGWGWGLPLDKVAEWAGENVGAGCELIRWAANSDKWVLQNVGWHGHAGSLASGSNSVAANWIDKVAFNVTKNPELPEGDANGIMYMNNCTGDMWIDDPENNPQGNKYEDLQGVWHVVSDATPVRNPAVSGHGDARQVGWIAGERLLHVRVDGASPARVSVVTMHGRTVGQTVARGTAALSIDDVASGPVMVIVNQDGRTTARRAMVR